MIKIRYWRDSAGPEVDFVLEIANQYIPIEVKWSDKPTIKDAKHLIRFLGEYENSSVGFVVCRTPKEYMLSSAKNIRVLPWHHMHEILMNLSGY